MSAIDDPGLLHLHNRTGSPVLLRFRCAGRLAWEGWAPAGGKLAVPGAGAHAPLVSLSCVDPLTRVATTLAGRPAGFGTRLVAGQRQLGRAALLECRAEAGSRPDALELANTLAAAVCFELLFAATPFALRCPVAPGARLTLDIGAFDFTATLAGITSAVFPVRQWQSELEVLATKLNGNELPQLRPLAGHAANGAPGRIDTKGNMS
jgi:hypothetical protein